MHHLLFLADGVLDISEYTDGMSAYGYSTRQCQDAFKLFAKVTFFKKCFNTFLLGKRQNNPQAMGETLFRILLVERQERARKSSIWENQSLKNCVFL